MENVMYCLWLVNPAQFQASLIQQTEPFQIQQNQVNNALSTPTSPCQLEHSVSEPCTEKHSSTFDTTTTRLPSCNDISSRLIAHELSSLKTDIMLVKSDISFLKNKTPIPPSDLHASHEISSVKEESISDVPPVQNPQRNETSLMITACVELLWSF